jgi:mannose-6-phosphate isomerase-like protein (cupin superfamily)
MASYVIFYIVSGRIGLNIDNEYTEAGKDQCVISEPGNHQMEALEAAKILGIQIQKSE